MSLQGYGAVRLLPSAFTRLLTDTGRWLEERPDRPEISDPSCPAARFDHRLSQQDYETFRSRFRGYVVKISSAFEAKDRDESLALWREIFGDAFTPARPRPVTMTSPADLADQDPGHADSQIAGCAWAASAWTGSPRQSTKFALWRRWRHNGAVPSGDMG